mgnify:CR=1 FL=1
MASGTELRAFLPGGLEAERVELVDGRVLIHARPVGSAAACPRCGEISRRVHSHYRRRLADLPAHGRQVSIDLSALRFRCRSVSCRARILAERLTPAIVSLTDGGRGVSKTWPVISVSPSVGGQLRPWLHDCSCQSPKTPSCAVSAPR